MGATILAGKFGLSAAPYGAPGGGTDYANGAGFTLAPGPMLGNVPRSSRFRTTWPRSTMWPIPTPCTKSVPATPICSRVT